MATLVFLGTENSVLSSLLCLCAYSRVGCLSWCPNHSCTIIHRLKAEKEVEQRASMRSRAKTLLPGELSAILPCPSLANFPDLPLLSLVRSSFHSFRISGDSTCFTLEVWLNMLQAASWQYKVDAVEMLQITTFYFPSSRQAPLKLFQTDEHSSWS